MTQSASRRWKLARRAEIVALAATLAVCGMVALQAPAIADRDQPAVSSVPEQDVQPIVAAALACPTLSPPRLAAQLMAASGFEHRRAGDGKATGVAAVDAESWKRFKPSPSALRSDRDANITALAHQTCKTVGKLRSKGMTGDLWPSAVAAIESGTDAVLVAKAVPAQSREYVDKVARYAEYYSRNAPFKVTDNARTVTTVAPAAVIPVPDKYVQVIQAAGRICPTVTPSRIAAHLRAASNFDPNLRTEAGDGVAQFPPALWSKYRPRTKASLWEPDDAIMALGIALCDLSSQFAGLTGGDPFTLALGAFQWGPEVIRQANGLPRASVRQFSESVQQTVPAYEGDPRLQPRKREDKATTPARKPKTRSTRPSSSPDPRSRPAPESAPLLVENSGSPLPYEVGATYQLVNPWAKDSVLELPGVSDNKTSGTLAQLWDNNHAPDQYWRIDKSGVAGWVVITNAYSGLSLGIEGSSEDNYAKLAQFTTDKSDPNQQWSIQGTGDGQVKIVNRNSGKALDLLGDDLGAPVADGTWNGYRVEQFDYQDSAHDQRWKLIK
jgi:hypothetical protein